MHLFTEVDSDNKTIVLDIVSTAFNQAIAYAEMYHDQAGTRLMWNIDLIADLVL